jgi:maleylacetate reductase
VRSSNGKCSSGSETTSILGQLKDGIKTTQKSMTVLPQVIVYDVDLTMDLPAQMTITSGVNAIAHAVEALYATECSPLIELMALQGIQSLSKALPILSKDPTDKEARSDALHGAWACGTCLGAVGMALHHKMCHVVRRKTYFHVCFKLS